MLIPAGTGLNKKGNAESFLGILAKEYETAIMRNLIRGGGDTSWILESGNIFEIVGKRKNLLSHYDVMAFLTAILHLEREFMQNNEEEEFWEVFRDSGFFLDTGGLDEYVMNNIFYNVGKEHKKLIPKILTFPERLFILRELYILLKSEDKHEPDEVLERNILLGMVMIQFLNLGIRPYMLEPDKNCRIKMLEEGRDWVYELSELFHDFSNDSFYHMGGYGQMYESIKHQALQLQERKEKKIRDIRYASTVAMEDIILEKNRKSIEQGASQVIFQVIERVIKNEVMTLDLFRRIMN